MLDVITVGGWKSYGKPQRVTLAPLTVLIGANASGKSNVIEAMQLFAWLARGKRLGDLAHALREGELPVRGRVQDLFASPVELGCEVGSLKLSLSVGLLGQAPRVRGEQLDDADSGTKLPLFRVERPASEHGSELVVAYNNFVRGKTKPQITCIDQQAVFTQLLTPARFEATHDKSQKWIPEACERVRRALEDVLFLDPAPRAMRAYSYLDEVRLAPNGANVSAVLFHVCSAGRHDEVLAFVKALPEQDVRRVQFLEGPRNDVMLQLVETFGGEERSIDAAVLSDGTLRVLAVAAAVLSVEPGSLVVIEQIDNGVHPSRARQLMSTLQDVADKRNIRLLVTTHNPALLDAIPLGSVGDAVACFRDPISGESRLQRLRDLPDYVAVTARGPLGVLSTSGALDRFLKHRRTEAEQDEQAQRALRFFRDAGE